MLPPNAKVVQVAWVVPDIEAAMAEWHRKTGVGPFLMLRHLPFESVTYRGRASTLDITAAVVQSGDVQLELIEQHCDSPSAYRDVIGKGGTAFHHLGVIVPDYAAEVRRYEAMGIVAATTGGIGELRFAYMDTAATLGAMVEVIQDTDRTREIFGRVKEMADAWDGRGPISVEA